MTEALGSEDSLGMDVVVGQGGGEVGERENVRNYGRSPSQADHFF